MALKADSSFITSTVSLIDTETTNYSKKTVPIYKYTRELYAGEPIYNKKGSLLIYYLQCLYAGMLTTNIRYYLKSSYGIINIPQESCIKVTANMKLQELYNKALA